MLKPKKNPITVEEILAKCPGPVISRKAGAKIIGGLISEKTLANLDSLGEGPEERVRLGRKSGYVSLSFAKWAVGRLEKRQ